MQANRMRIAPLDLARLYQQLADLLLAGLPLTECFDILRQDIESPQLASVVNKLYSAAQQGLSLSECFAKSALPTRDVVCRLLDDVQTHQEMHSILMALADEQDQLALITKVKRKLLFWPLVYLFFAGFFMVLISIFVLPEFQDFYSGVNASLPMLTQIMLLFGPYVVFLLLGLVAGWYILYKVELPLAQTITDHILVRIPILGELSKRIAVSQYIRALCLFLLRKVPPQEALVLAAQSVDNTKIARDLMRDTTNPTLSLLENLRASVLVPKHFIKAIMIAERTNTAEGVLRYTIDAQSAAMVDDMMLFQDDIELFSKIAVGILFALIAVAVYLPIFKMGAVI